MGYTHTMELYSASKRNEQLATTTWMCLRQCRAKGRRTNSMPCDSFVWNSWTCRPISDVRNKDCKLLGTRARDWEGARAAWVAKVSSIRGEAFLLPCIVWPAFGGISMSVRFSLNQQFYAATHCILIKKWLHGLKKEAPSRLPPILANSSPSSCWQIREILRLSHCRASRESRADPCILNVIS